MKSYIVCWQKEDGEYCRREIHDKKDAEEMLEFLKENATTEFEPYIYEASE